MDLLSALRANPFLLAPMAAITDRPFRTIMRRLGCGVVISELVSAHGIEYKSEKTLRLMEYDEVQRPVGIQLFGETPEVLARAAQVVQEHGADFVDLNFGCPVPKVTKKGAGSAILRDLPRVTEVFRAVRGAVTIPVTVKIRTGWDETSRNADQVAQIAYDEGLTWVAIHGRTRAQNYNGQADWDYIAEVKSRVKIPIIGNGDIASGRQAVERILQAGVDGVMIGRGCLKNPWIFREAMELWRPKRPNPSAPGMPVPLVADASPHSIRLSGVDEAFMREKDYERLLMEIHDAFLLCTDEKITQLQLKKFASWYSSGYPGASNFRKAIFQTQSLGETLDLTMSYFATLREALQADTSHEGFLMGGHG